MESSIFQVNFFAMNIFFLSDDPKEAASLQADVHVVKMILEILQMLCVSIRCSRSVFVLPFELYKETHVNHPCAKWMRYSTKHYHWALKHGMALCEMYQRRYAKVHKCDPLYRKLLDLPLPSFAKMTMEDFDERKISFHQIPGDLEFIPLAMDDEAFAKCATYLESGILTTSDHDALSSMIKVVEKSGHHVHVVSSSRETLHTMSTLIRVSLLIDLKGIDTYRKYYMSKRHTMKRKMCWEGNVECPKKLKKFESVL